MSDDEGRGARIAAAAFGAWGVLQLARPDLVLRTVSPEPHPRPLVWAGRALGARLAVQNGLVLARPTRGTVLTGAVVDGLHALSMLAVALLWRDYRRPALASGATAAFSAVICVATAPRAS